jgi:hypothetical protein
VERRRACKRAADDRPAVRRIEEGRMRKGFVIAGLTRNDRTTL